MDFPAFHLDFFGNRMLIAVIGILHVIINHAMAVGMIPLIAAMEWWGWKQNDKRWDDLAYKTLFVCFIITTSLGALTGVGIWFSAALINPYAISSLIRVFFWGWFTEWIVFVIEVALILWYFLSWKRWPANRKLQHVAIGFALAVFSWLTMAIIVGILGYMMDIGTWTSEKGIIAGFFNPVYIPQLYFRTPWAMVAAGLFTMFLAYFFTVKGDAFRNTVMRFLSVWILIWTPILAFFAYLYWKVVPPLMSANFDTALLTQNYTDWSSQVYILIAAITGVVYLIILWGLIFPNWLPRVSMVLPFILMLVLFGSFERVREFVRKPYVISYYMYSNGIRVDDYPLFNDQGLLKHATYVSTRTITDENKLIAGKDVFMISCSRCHTVKGINSVITKWNDLYGRDAWDTEKVKNFMRGMHNVRIYMPPFPGNEAELDALAAYMVSLQRFPDALEGAQTVGVRVPSISHFAAESGNSSQ